MGEPYLHAVDSGGVVTPPPPFEPPTPERPKRAPTKARPRYPVPTDRMKFSTQELALRTICTASRNGQEPVTAEKMGSLMGILPVTAVLNNTFFASVGLLNKAGKGAYVPSDVALKFQQKWSFNKQEAPAILAPNFADSWFFRAVSEKLALGEATVDEMVETLASVAGTDDSYATQYRFLLEWLDYVGLISTDGGAVKLVRAAPPRHEQGDMPAAVDEEEVPPQVSKPTEGRPSAPRSAPPIISMTINIVVTADDLARLSSEQITALFDGIGKVASVKEALKV